MSTQPNSNSSTAPSLVCMFVLPVTTISLPKWYVDKYHFNLFSIKDKNEQSKICKELMAGEWVIPALQDEINQFKPTTTDIDPKNGNQQNRVTFSTICSQLLLSGRYFANFKQLHQYLHLLYSA